MDKRFLRAYTDPNKVRILGHDLYPWCIKYRVWLTAFESPLITGKPVTPADLLLAVKICSEVPIGKPSLIDRWRVIGMRIRPYEFNRAMQAFLDYALVAHWPKFWEKKGKGDGNSSGLPWALAVVSNLIANGIEEKRAWEMPECQAIWMNTAFGIRSGADIKVLSSEMEEELDRLEQLGKVANAPKETDQENGAGA